MKKLLILILAVALYHCNVQPQIIYKEILPPTDPPAIPLQIQPPANFRAIAGLTDITLTWNAVADAVSYNLYRSQLPGVSKANGTKYAGVTSGVIQTGLISQAVYHYVVTSVDANGVESADSPELISETGVIDYGNSTVYIYPQNLTWTKCNVASASGTMYTPSPNDCTTGSALQVQYCVINDNSCDNGVVAWVGGNWSGVWHACDNLNVNHYQGRIWRVPLYNELMGLAGHYANNKAVFDHMTPGYYWTADASIPRTVDIINNTSAVTDRTVMANMMCVSDGP